MTNLLYAFALMLCWNYPAQDSNIVFNVRSVSTNRVCCPSCAWPVVATTRNQFYGFNVDPQATMTLFSVTASNTLTGEESGFATR
ncbi:MAG TPA: hypothetical protein VMU04_10250 [Candidatus Acidoferrum sp.]|nr:hypothetical protein [Candidatus Acidoferrum sp.]